MAITLKDYTDDDWVFIYTNQPSRRPIFSDGDVFRFFADKKRTDVLYLTVFPFDGSTDEQLASHILCEEKKAGELEASDYGRHMKFWIEIVKKKKVLKYTSTYALGPINNPDEGGDGDPIA